MASVTPAVLKRRRPFVALVVAAAIAIPLVIAPNAEAARSRFGVVVVHNNGDVDTECVRMARDKILAFDLLQETSFDFYTQDFGDFGRGICWLDGEGYVPPDCFGGANDPGWGLWYQKKPKRGPRLSNVGLSTLKVKAKGVIYLVFRPFDQPGFTQLPPDAVHIKTIC